MIDDLLSASTPIPGNFEVLKAAGALPSKRVLDVGFGKGSASLVFALAGKEVDALTVGAHCINLTRRHFEVFGITALDSPFMEFNGEGGYDQIWMSHMLEHGPNPGRTISKVRDLLRDDGWFCVIVPPFKHKVVRGHLSVGWNLGILAYNLLVHGFDVRNGHFIKHGYNVAAFVRKHRAHDSFLEKLDATDILVNTIMTKSTADAYWPSEMVAGMDEMGGFEGDLESANWPDELRRAMTDPVRIGVSNDLVRWLNSLGPV